VRFESEGRIEWAILAPAPVKKLEEIVAKLRAPYFSAGDDEDEPRSWCVVKGKKKHAAVIETAPGSSGTEIDLAKALSKQLGAIVHALGFAGYDDPDHGIPHVTRYEGGKAVHTSEDDPFDFADEHGCALRSYFETC